MLSNHKHFYLFLLSFFIFLIILVFKPLYEWIVFFPVLYILLAKYIFKLHSKLIFFLLTTIFMGELILGSPTRTFIHKNTFYSCQSLSFFEFNNIEHLTNLLGNKDVLIDQIMNCNIEGEAYDNYLVANIDNDAPDEAFVVRTFSMKRAANIYDYLVKKYNLSTRYTKEQIIQSTYNPIEIAAIHDDLKNEMQLKNK